MLSQLLSGHFTLESIIAEILAVLLIIFLILPFHEWAHAEAAYLLGDKGIKERGRLSLNPLSHIDPVGALFMLLIGFGWAKPVPVDSRYFKNPKLGMGITALMGPVANLVAGFAGLLVYYGIKCASPSFLVSDGLGEIVCVFLVFYVQVNVNLAVFNLLPIPPLDGSKILFTVLPDSAVAFFYRYQMVFFAALFILIYTGPLSSLIGFLSGGMLSGMSWLAMQPFKLFGLL
ncbi:MAG: site-2 protease family protein [Ruminococcus sp.]|nr:site-2 protease family protein [Ruminococcus sp.]